MIIPLSVQLYNQASINNVQPNISSRSHKVTVSDQLLTSVRSNHRLVIRLSDLWDSYTSPFMKFSHRLWMVVTPRVWFWHLMVGMTMRPSFACHFHNNISGRGHTRPKYFSHLEISLTDQGWWYMSRVCKYPTKIISAPISPSVTVNSAACKCKPNSWVNKCLFNMKFCV